MSEPIITTGMEYENLCNISIYLDKFQSSAYLKNTEKEMKWKLQIYLYIERAWRKFTVNIFMIKL